MIFFTTIEQIYESFKTFYLFLIKKIIIKMFSTKFYMLI